MAKRRRRTADDQASFKGMGIAIRQLRQEAKLTQAALAYESGISVSALRRIEKGQAEAKWDTLRAVAYGLKVELPRLIRIAEENAPGRGGGSWGLAEPGNVTRRTVRPSPRMGTRRAMKPRGQDLKGERA